MIDLVLRPFRALAAAIRRWQMQRAARRLLAENPPRGLPPPARPFQLALRVPPGPLEAPEGEFWTLPLGAQAVRGRGPARLLRLSALPPPLRRIDGVQDLAPRKPALSRVKVPDLLELPPPLQSRVRDLGLARPAHFRLDANFMLPPEVDPLRLAADAPPPAPARRVRPRTPLARAPVHRVNLRNYRLDPRTGRGQNEGILPLHPRDTSWWWINASLRREKIDLPWMATERIRFLGPMQTEWFIMWWDSVADKKPGAKDPQDWVQPREIFFAMEANKEQMLIRRDVKKDEIGPNLEDAKWEGQGLEPAMQDHEHIDLQALVPEKQWVDIDHGLEPVPFDRGQQEAYLMWRTLVNALEER